MPDNRVFYFTGKNGRGGYYTNVTQGGEWVSYQNGFPDRYRAYRYARHMAELCAKRKGTVTVASTRA